MLVILMSKLYIATLDDIDSCMECAKDFVSYFGMEWHEESVRNTFTHIITNGVFIIAKEGDEVLGGAAALTIPNMWNNTQVFFQEMFWWVVEKHRGSSIGIKLLLTLETYAPTDSTIVLSLLPHSNIKDSTLIKLGYNLKEKSYVKE